MYKTTINFHNKINQNKTPISYVVIQTDFGYRAYGEKELSLIADVEATIADGTYIADGSRLAGSGIGFLEKSGRLMSMSGFNRTSQKTNAGLLLGYTKKLQQNMTIKLNNADRYFSKLIAKEPFLTKTLTVYLGFESLPFSEDLSIFKGTITEVSILKKDLQLEAVE